MLSQSKVTWRTMLSRMKMGGPPALPSTWRNKSPVDIVMSLTSPEVTEGNTLVVLQATSQLPAFGRYCIPVSGEIREDRVSDNPTGDEHFWTPITNRFWEPCRKKRIPQYGMAASHAECSLCPGARAYELLPCCWCTNWVHVKCSYAVPEGRACAAHFDVVNQSIRQASCHQYGRPSGSRGIQGKIRLPEYCGA